MQRCFRSVLLAILLLCPVRAGSQIIPQERCITWQGNVGVEGGIPERTKLRNCQIEDGAAGDGVADDTAAIQSCIDNTAPGSVAYLPEGTYLVTDTLVMQGGITLRGDGPGLTRIMSGIASANAILFFSGERNAWNRSHSTGTTATASISSRKSGSASPDT